MDKPVLWLGSSLDDLYVARFAEGVYVLHAFEKRSAKTPKKDLELARTRFRELLANRRRKQHGKERN